MRADADEAVRRFAAESFITPAPVFYQGLARVLPVTSMAATRPFRMRPASRRESARPRFSRLRYSSAR
jgi:hypothetical protein